MPVSFRHGRFFLRFFRDHALGRQKQCGHAGGVLHREPHNFSWIHNPRLHQILHLIQLRVVSQMTGRGDDFLRVPRRRLREDLVIHERAMAGRELLAGDRSEKRADAIGIDEREPGGRQRFRSSSSVALCASTRARSR